MEETSTLSVTAICLTRNRPDWLKRSIHCFLTQTYPNRKLVIVADGEDVSSIVPPDLRIRYVHIPDTPTQMIIGNKRNLGCSLADTDLICNWDDDDWNNPDRIANQAGLISRTKYQVVGYRTLKFFDGPHWWEYTGVQKWAAGTSLMFRKSWWDLHPFPSVHTCEDNEFVRIAQGVIAVTDGGDNIWAAIWQGNTSKKIMTPPSWKRIDAPALPVEFTR